MYLSFSAALMDGFPEIKKAVREAQLLRVEVYRVIMALGGWLGLAPRDQCPHRRLLVVHHLRWDLHQPHDMGS